MMYTIHSELDAYEKVSSFPSASTTFPENGDTSNKLGEEWVTEAQKWIGRRCDAYFQCDKSESLIEMSYFDAIKKVTFATKTVGWHQQCWQQQQLEECGRIKIKIH